MSPKEQSRYPYVSVAAWGLGVFLLVLVNSGNVVLAVLLGGVVALISLHLERRGRDQAGGGESS